MILNLVRCRGRSEEEWRTWKFTHVSGRLQNILCATGSLPDLRLLGAAVTYALAGESSPLVHEVAIQLADDGGHTWTVQRRGDAIRIFKDGVQLSGGDAAEQLREAFIDASLDAAENPGALPVSGFELRGDGDHLELLLVGAGATGGPAAKDAQDLKAVAEKQIAVVAGDSARLVALPQLADARLLIQLADKLQPLHGQYCELARQYTELKEETPNLVAKDQPQATQLATELEILDQLADAAQPLLQPGASMKAYKQELAQLEDDIATTCAAIGIETADSQPPPRDFAAAIAALSRLEAQTQLVRAAQAARLFCEERIEPVYQTYLQLAETGLAGDRQVHAELESCLGSLGMKLRASDAAQSSQQDNKTWFERFKARQAGGRDGELNPTEIQVRNDIETAHMAISYALNRLNQLSATLGTARQEHTGVLTTITAVHAELIGNLGQLREEWLAIARAAELPEDLRLDHLLHVANHHGQLLKLCDRRAAVLQLVHTYQTRMVKVERLVLDWRKTTGSQNLTDLSNPTILLSEATGLLRYHDAKRRRLAQLRQTAVDNQTSATILELLKGRRKALLTQWREAFATISPSPLEIHDERLPEFFRAAALLRALYVVHGVSPKSPPRQLFGATSAILSTYLWETAETVAEQRLALVQALEDADPAGVRLLLVADHDVAALLIPAGAGRVTELIRAQSPATPAVVAREFAHKASVSAPPAAASVPPKAMPTAVIKNQQVATAGRSAQPSAPAAAALGRGAQATPPLNDRARRALEAFAKK